MSGEAEVERLLARALAPVEPPAHLVARVRATLQTISVMAAEELESWERAAMRDPRRWVRPAIALVAGTLAGVGLVLLGIQRRRLLVVARQKLERATELPSPRR